MSSYTDEAEAEIDAFLTRCGPGALNEEQSAHMRTLLIKAGRVSSAGDLHNAIAQAIAWMDQGKALAGDPEAQKAHAATRIWGDPPAKAESDTPDQNPPE